MTDASFAQAAERELLHKKLQKLGIQKNTDNYVYPDRMVYYHAAYSPTTFLIYDADGIGWHINVYDTVWDWVPCSKSRLRRKCARFDLELEKLGFRCGDQDPKK